MQSLLSVFAGRGGEHKTTHGDFDLFIQEVNNENVEHLSFRRELDATKEVKPTFEQISQDRILDEANKNIQVLKSLETILQERSQAFETFLSAQARYKSSFDIFQYCEGTLRQSLDALFVFLEQDFQQARQQQLLNDLRRALSEVKVDAQKRLADYQREVNGAEKEVAAAEKRLSKSKDVLEKTLELRRELKHKLEMGDHEREQLTSPRMPGGILSRSMASSSHRESNRLERLRDCEETIARCEKDIREDIRCLLRALGRRDHVLIASRRAYQKLDRECRKAVAHTFRRLVVREREAAAAREVGLSKLEAAVQRMDVDADVDDFVGRHRSSDEEALQLSSQALTVLWDLMVPDGEVHAVSPASAALSDGGCGPSNNQSPSQLKHARDGSSRSHSRVSSPVQMAPLRSQGSGPDDAPPPPPAPAPSQGHTPQAARQPKFVVTDATLVDEVPAFATEVPDAVSLPIHATPQGRHRLIRYRPPHLPQYHALDGTHSSGGSGSNGSSSNSNSSSSSSSSSNSTSTVSSAVTGSGMAVAATASATLSMAVAGGLPIVEAFASIVNMYGRQPEQPEQPSEPEEDVSTDTINEHLNRIFYGSINPFSPMPWTAPRHGADTPSTVPMTSVPSGQSPPPARSPEPADANTSADASLSDEDIKVTPMRVIGVDEVSIGAGPRAQLLLAQEGDKLEALQIEDYIGAADGDAWPPKSVVKSARKPAAMPSNVNTDSSGACGDAGGSTAAVAAGDGFALAAPSTERDGVGASDPTEVADDSSLDESVAWLSDVVRTQKGRDAFISALNQFRSKKVDVGDGFAALGAVLWDLLDQCSLSNDVHSAKVIMMLSQTFYRRRQPSSQQLAADGPPTPRQIASATASVSRGVVRAGLGSRSGSDSELDLAHFDDADPVTRALDASDDADGTASSGARLRRDYLKDMLISHTIWRDGSFWEQALWQCTIEQLQTIPYERAWYDLDGEGRAEAVRRVHSVIFSQVMAITHSMMELGCSKAQTREFLYRMCVVHQLSERQRQQLLSHLLSR